MREGRAVLSDFDSELDISYEEVLNTSVVKKLGSSYNTDLTFDPWGNLYQIYPGPWPAPGNIPCSNNRYQTNDPLNPNLNVFRIYTVEDEDNKLPGTKGGAKSDGKTEDVEDPVTEDFVEVGFAAPRDVRAYVYSMGENMLSSQALYVHPNNFVYDESQSEEYKGGGDDINNWDKGRSWMVFYN